MSETIRRIDVDKFQALFSRPAIDPEMQGLIEVSGWLVTNDRGYSRIAGGLHDLQAKKTRGMGLFIGAGGLLSMLPDLNIDLAIVADMSRSVIEFNRTLASLVESATTPKAVMDFVTTTANDPTHPQPDVLELMKLAGVRIKERRSELGRLIEDEAAEYGEYHWTDPKRFPKVQRALGEVPVIWAWTEVSSNHFRDALNSVSKDSELKLMFANFTNFHEWLDSTPLTRPIETFMREWPIGQLAALYTFRSDEKMRVASSIDEYLDALKA